MGEKLTITMCELEDGSHSLYDMALELTSNADPVSTGLWKYIVIGKIYSIDGDLYKGNQCYKFYQRKEKNK